jgi:photoactive yellow protein
MAILEPASLDFDAPDLAARIERLTQAQLDAVPFGVIELDPAGTVLIYNANEVRLSGYGTTPLGRNFFAVSRNPNKGELQTRIMRAMEEGPVDLEFGWRGGTGAAERELRLRVLSSRRGGVWIFIERDDGNVRRSA